MSWYWSSQAGSWAGWALSLSLSLYVKTTISMSVAQYSVCDLYLALPRLLEPLPALCWPTDATPYFPPGQVLSWSGKFCAFCPDKVFKWAQELCYP